MELIGNTGEGIDPVPVPRPPAKAEGLAILVEEGAIWPVSPVPYTDIVARQKEQAETHAEALALARAREARSAGGDLLLKFAFAVGIVAVLILVLIIGVVAIDARLGGGQSVETANVMSIGRTHLW